MLGITNNPFIFNNKDVMFTAQVFQQKKVLAMLA